MKYYEVAEITLNLNSKGYETGDEESSYMGPDYKKAICVCDEALSNWERLDYRDKKESAIEGRIYEIPDDTDINDKDEIINAICDACEYDTFFSHYPEDDFKKSQEKINALINA